MSLTRTITRFALTSTLLFGTQVQAMEVSGVEIPKQIMLAQTELQLNGAGVRSKFFIDLYVGSLYLTSADSDVTSILNADNSAVRLNITSGMITADKMRDAINEGFEDATKGQTAAIQQKIDTFMALFSEEIKEGDQFTFATSKSSGVTAYKNGVIQATIKGEIFRQALLNIWLGDEPAQTSLKEAMLGL
ncbi:chalcone isomerase family protein [Shewanella sp. D64]|uniref:chalcone isomerase family protein n=1 Tax=unclassified Shewanella TaxID=196818 RepID=UPI0022BA17BF|nr:MULTISPECIES: chalcone isomerase family protein [unclassified Shewanella]MEC4726570.1 chalcone isomerase family protein [Shewanella sp. D64]MEC4737389.1 chalcone isomerase family protein [Shewanella sp. E94]WBJ98133.1 chalcone isomerase family protein [Shewanella sp. MTB7]